MKRKAAAVPRAAAAVLAITAASPFPEARGQVQPPAPPTLAVGEWQIAPVVEVRARGEYRRDLDAADRGAIALRVRLGLDATRPFVEARAVVEDARLFELSGSDFVAGPPPTAFTGAFEAWAEAHTEPVGASFVRVGRQRVTWGEGRLLGAAEESPAGRFLDAVRARAVVGDASAELLAAVLDDARTSAGYSMAPYGEIFGARAEYAVDPAFAVEAYGLARIAQSDPAVGVPPGSAGCGADAPCAIGGSSLVENGVRGQTYAAALRLHGERAAWSWGAEGAIEFGHVDAVVRPGGVEPERRLAWAAAGHVGYTFERAVLSPTLGLGASYASGDDGSHVDHQFDPLLPDVREWHGAMDLFAWSNEAEASARVAIAPWTDGVAAVEYRYARLATPSGPWLNGYLLAIGQANGNTSGELGHEVDASVSWSPWTPVRLGAGYSLFVLGGGARAIRPDAGPLAHFAFADVRVSL